jgi:Na+/serine symporter
MVDYSIGARIQESLPLIFMFFLACIASLLRADKHSLLTIITGVVLSGFVAYSVNLLLVHFDIAENIRIVCVGGAAYLNRYIVDLLDRLATQIVSNPKQALKDIKALWKK